MVLFRWPPLVAGVLGAVVLINLGWWVVVVPVAYFLGAAGALMDHYEREP